MSWITHRKLVSDARPKTKHRATAGPRSAWVPNEEAKPPRPGLMERIAGSSLVAVGAAAGLPIAYDVGMGQFRGPFAWVMFGATAAIAGMFIWYIGWRKKRQAAQFAAIEPDILDRGTAATLQRALGDDTAPLTADGVAPLTRHEDIRVRLAAATALGVLGDAESMAPLKRRRRAARHEQEAAALDVALERIAARVHPSQGTLALADDELLGSLTYGDAAAGGEMMFAPQDEPA